MAISKSFSLDKNKKYAVMLKVSDDKGITIKHDGAYKAITKNTWKVLNKISDKETTEVSFIGSTPDVNVLLYVIEITSKEFEESNNEVQLLSKYNNNYKQSEISIKLEEIDIINFSIEAVDEQINLLKHDISIEENFTDEQIKERNQFIYEQTWEDGNYYDDQELYDDAIKKFEELKVPKLVFDISIVNFLEVMEEQRNWDKLSVGDKVLIHYERFNINVEAIVLEIHYDFENQDISLTIANVKDVMKDEDKLAKFLYDSYSTSNTVDMSKYRWTETERTVSGLEEQINGEFDATKRRIIAGADESVEISNRGVKITSPSNPLEMLIANAGVIALSDDGGDTFNSAIVAGKGVIAERVVGKLIIGVNLLMENESGKFTFDQNGVVIDAASFTVKDANGNNLLEVWNKAITEDEEYNGVIISPTDGIVVKRSDNKAKTTLNATDGIKIEKSTDNGVSWNNVFYVDTNGNLTFSGNLSGASGTFTGNITSTSLYVGSDNDTEITLGTYYGDQTGYPTIRAYTTAYSPEQVFPSELNIGLKELKTSTNLTQLQKLNLYAKEINSTGLINLNNNILSFSGTSGTNIDHIWHDDTNNIFHFISDGSSKSGGNSNLKASTYIGDRFRSSVSSDSDYIEFSNSRDMKVVIRGEQALYVDRDIAAGWTRAKIGRVFLKGSDYSTTGNILEIRNNADDSFIEVKALEFTAMSDENMKKNIEELRIDAIDIFKKQVKFKEYNIWDDKEDSKKRIGLIAQETPDLISNELGVDLYAMITLTGKALQEVIERLEFLENRFK